MKPALSCLHIHKRTASNPFLLFHAVLQNEVHNLTAKIGSLCEDFDICEAGLFELKITGEILELQNRMDLQRFSVFEMPFVVALVCRCLSLSLP